MRKTLFSAVSIVIILFSFSLAASAQQMGRGMMGQGQGMGPGMMHDGYGMNQDTSNGDWNRMSPDQQEEWEKMRIEFRKDTLPLRQKLVTKQLELSTLWEEKTPDPDKAKSLSKEISGLQSQLLNKRNEFLIQCRGKFGNQGWSCPGSDYGMDPGMMGQGRGMGPGMMGQGRGMGPGMMGQGYGMGPGMMGQGYGMGPGMMGQGYGMGPGMMGQGYGMGPGMMHDGRGMSPGEMHQGWGMGSQYGSRPGPGYQGQQYQQPQKIMEEDDAKGLLEKYLESTRNPNLKLGKIKDKGESFVAEIYTKDGSLVDNILVDKKTGWMRSVY
jgi:Spy/CpxP family protein refolding chaperone